MSGKLERYVRDLSRQVDGMHVPGPAGPGAFDGTILDAMDAAGMTGPTWAAWRVFWKAVFALPMDDDERALFTAHTHRATPPVAPVREAWAIVGRRGGKSRNFALGTFYLGIRRDYRGILAPGEEGVVPVIAADRKQARQVLRYIRGLAALPAFAPYLRRQLAESIELRTGVTIEVHTASYRTTRGYSIPGLVGDELAFWRDEESANPDTEVLAALRPGMATVPDALLLAGSTPYGRRGELHKMWQRYFGEASPDVLVWVAPSRVMNPALPASVVERAFAEDPVAAAAEYGAEFRQDVHAFLDPEAIAAVIPLERRELPPQESVSYVAFVDPSGGSQDSMTLAVAHLEGERAVLDCVRERRPPFSPEDVVADFAGVLRTYHVTTVTGDRYAGQWPRERFAVHGILYAPSERTKSEIYRELLPGVNAGRVEMLDVPVLRTQLATLERRVARGGKDSIDHPPGGRDDVANAAAGALVQVLGGTGFITDIEIPVLRRSAMLDSY
jgi:hypothetical protein